MTQLYITHQLPDDLRLEGRPRAGDGPLGPRHGGGGRPLRVVPGGAGEAAGARPRQPADLVHLPGVLLVVKYLLVSPTRPVFHVCQGANPGANLEIQLLVVNFYISPTGLMVDVLLAANPGVD